jgi:uncharacterized protein YbcI
MDKSKSTIARRIAQAALTFEQRRTGKHVPTSVSLVPSEGTLVITQHEALSPAERALSKTPDGANGVTRLRMSRCRSPADPLRDSRNPAACNDSAPLQ